MLGLPRSVRIYFATERVDLRRGHDGLCALVRTTIEEDAYISYVFTPDRSGKTPSAVLGASSGTLVVDGYTGYNVVTTPESRERAGCLAHTRRKLFAALEQHPEAREALDIIRDIYVVEHDAKTAEVARTSEHLSMRQARSRPLMEAFCVAEGARRTSSAEGPRGPSDPICT